MEFGPLGEEVYKRTYSRVKADGFNERWHETVERTVRGNVELAGLLGSGEFTEAEIREAIEDMRIIPAGRHLWASGADSGLGLFNCHRAGWGPELSDHFTFTFDQLMLGGGVGANYSSEYLVDLPPIVRVPEVEIILSKDHPDWDSFQDAGIRAEASTRAIPFYVENSREGWVDALRYLLEVAELGSVAILPFDLSDVRGYGEPIKGFGGTASGPLSLALMLQNVAEVLDVGTLTPLQAMSVDHEIAACVVAGNVRRSARMSIVHWRDPYALEFLECKSDPSKHWSTNISLEVDSDFWVSIEEEDPYALSILAILSKGMLENGEPGIYNSSLASAGERGDVRASNPCGEIALEEWEQCCLGHINLAHPAHLKSGAELERSFRMMGAFLVRATLAPSSDARQEEVKNRNRRVGVGFFGFQEYLASKGVLYSEAEGNPGIVQDLIRWRMAARLSADAEADRLHVNRPIKATTIAPTGTIAKLPGTTEGIHPVYARHFIRRVRYANGSPSLALLVDRGHPVEADHYTANTSVVSFYVEDSAVAKYGSLIEDVTDLSLGAMLSAQMLVQSVYADNAVSYTVNIAPDQYTVAELAAALTIYGPFLKGTTVFPDLSRPQSPMERITEGQYRAAINHEIGQSIDDNCSSGACPVR